MTRAKPLRVPKTQFEYTKAAQAVTDLTPTQRSVLIALTDYVCRYGGAFPGHNTLSEKTGYSTRTIRRALKVLQDRGYVRRTATTRHGQGNSTNYYAVVLSTGQPSGLHVQALGQHIPISPDTESALNKSIEQTKEQLGRLVLQVEELLLTKLKCVIDLRRTPSLICLGRVSQWLFNTHGPKSFNAALEHLVRSATSLAEELIKKGTTLSSWDQLLDRLKESLPPQTAAGGNKPLDPLLDELWSELPSTERLHFRSRYNLGQLRLARTSKDITVRSSSPMALNYVQEHCRHAITSVEQRHKLRIRIDTRPTRGV